MAESGPTLGAGEIGVTAPSDSVRALAQIVQDAADLGAEPEALWRVAGIPDPDALDPNERVETDRVYDVIEAAVELTGFEDLYVRVQETRDISAFEGLGFAVATSATVRDALHQICRYAAFWTSDLQLECVEEERSARLRVRSSSRPRFGLHLRMAGMLASLVVHGRRACGWDWSPERVWLPGPEPADRTAYDRIFRAPITFEVGKAELSLDLELMETPLTQADPAMAEFFDAYLDEQVARIPREPTVMGEVKRTVRRLLPDGSPKLDLVARQLGMSARTLQRRLDEAGVSFQDIVTDVRRDLAQRHLEDPELSVSEVASRLGFSDASSFHRAFKKWNGMTPREWRRRSAPPPPGLSG